MLIILLIEILLYIFMFHNFPVYCTFVYILVNEVAIHTHLLFSINFNMYSYIYNVYDNNSLSIHKIMKTMNCTRLFFLCFMSCVCIYDVCV